jgi:hypothetical protein
MLLVSYVFEVVSWGGGVVWSITVVEPALSWLHGLRRADRKTLVLVSQAIEALRVEGPALGRPLVDTVKGSPCPTSRSCGLGRLAPARCECCSCLTRSAEP